MAVNLNIDTTKIQPIVGEIKEKYLQHIIAAAVVALLLWQVTPDSYGSFNTMLLNFPETLILLLVAMVISYMILVIGSSDSLIAKLKETGHFDVLNTKLTIATILSIGAFFLTIMVTRYFSWASNNFMIWNDPMTSHEVMFIILLFIISLAVVFFVSVLMALMKIAEMRTA